MTGSPSSTHHHPVLKTIILLAASTAILSTPVARGGDPYGHCTPCLHGCFNTKDGPVCNPPPKAPPKGIPLPHPTTCETWVDMYGPETSAHACVDGGDRDLAWALDSAGLDSTTDVAWCVTDRDGSSCGGPPAGGPDPCVEINKEDPPCDGVCCMLTLISQACGWCF